ncbi:hypothetical protein CSE16_07330 [Solibacillus sp. R5-41]|uniref:HAAS signaling domain-containing protein n=1 Tax=Solibacillus sp. R5-41 TaxID=2048654 RepID=UPI000C126D09|nr:hypothetical protein [Solibacillus sp. R5-41]ATP39881.1 hypothetical protein CSE16_07330 [Solibacillus sp. R5-41]
MEQINLYIYEVARRLPEKLRADIEMELRSTILDMIPDDYTADDVDTALTKLGDPAQLADQYRGQPNYLIGPMLFESYMTILKMAASIAVIVHVIVLTIQQITSFTPDTQLIESGIDLVIHFIGGSVEVLTQVFFWVTIIFVIIERVTDDGAKKSMLPKPWTPSDLKNIVPVEKKKRISKPEIFFELLGVIIWATVYFKASDLIGIYEQGGSHDKLHFVAPLFNRDVLLTLWPIIGSLILFEIGLILYKWIVGKWTNKIAVWNMIYHVALIIVTVIFIQQSNLFNTEFIRYTGEVFNAASDSVILNWWNSTIWAVVSVMIIISIIDIFNGFRKAKM